MSDILLIDDDVHAITVIRAALEMFGHRVRTSDGLDISEILNGNSPHVALVDLLLPGRSGMDLLRELHEAYPHAYLVLATGMGDVDLLFQAVSAGASSMLCKPYHISDVVQLIQLSALLAQAVSMEQSDNWESTDRVTFTRKGSETWQAADLARLMAYAHAHGANDAKAWRLAIGAAELMRNAQQHGAGMNADRNYHVDLREASRALILKVSDSGPGFDWWKELARARGGMDKTRASGLQIVCAAADELTFEDKGRTAVARFVLEQSPEGVQQ